MASTGWALVRAATPPKLVQVEEMEALLQLQETAAADAHTDMF
jgi:hypothetical protein